MRKLIARIALGVLGSLFLCVVVAACVYWFVEIRLQHFEFDFPVMQGMSKSSLVEYGVWTVSNSKYFVWQQGAWCHRDDCVDIDTVVSYFDVALEDLGWERINLENYNPCFGVLRETNFIYDGVLNGLYIGYRPDDDDDDIPSPIVCIAVWSEGELYEIKFMTRVISLRTRLYSSFD